MKIFLGDLVHSGERPSLSVMPLSVGFIASYAQKHMGSEVEFRLFKDARTMVKAIQNEKPDVVGLSYYVWNAHLNNWVFETAKQNINPNILTVGGGPGFTPLNTNEKEAFNFFRQQLSCDAYILDQGERGFVELMQRWIECNGNVKRLTADRLPGALVNAIATQGKVFVDPPMEPVIELDEIPSPYLCGLMDPFFDGPFAPLIETTRSCPFTCTYCTWGVKPKRLTRFSEERVLAEIDYISDHKPQSTHLLLADNNFAMVDRDEKFAKKLFESFQKTGFPSYVVVNWGKIRPERVLKVARAFGSITSIGASMQSLDPGVLKAIKRKNLTLDDIVKIQKELHTSGQGSRLFSELILGLPLETRESHIKALKILVDLDAEIYNYNLTFLPGSELVADEYREKYIRQTRWRLFDQAYGSYGGNKLFEGQEIVIETTTLSRNDIWSFRFIHFLLQFMWNRRWYYDYLMLLKQTGLHPVDVILAAASQAASDTGEIGELYREFESDHELENFKNWDELVEYWSQEEHFYRLMDGSYGKLNYLYTYKVLLEHRQAFDHFMYELTDRLSVDVPPVTRLELLTQCAEVLRFGALKAVEIKEDLSLVSNKRECFRYDVLTWSQGTQTQRPISALEGSCFEYEFYLEDKYKEILSSQLNLLYSGNLNATLRQISIDTNPDQFFYNVRHVVRETML